MATIEQQRAIATARARLRLQQQAPPQRQEPFVPSGEKTSGWVGGLMGYDPKALGITPAENIAGHPLTRFAMGAASPFLGAAQFGAEALGDTSGTETLKRTEELKHRGQAAMGGGQFDLTGLAGTAVSPAVLALRGIPGAASTTGRIAQGAAIGGGAGAVAPVTQGDDFMGSKAQQIGTGAALGAAIPAIAEGGKALVGGARNVADLFTEKGAGRILSRYQGKITGDQNRQAVIDALKRAEPPVPGYQQTAGEILGPTPAGSPLVAHQRITAGTPRGPSAAFGQRALDQKAALAKAMESRAEATGPMREAALERTQAVGVSTQKLMRQMRGVVSQPGIRASDVVRKTFADVKDKIKDFTSRDGFINAKDLYTIRKELGNTIQKNAKETANWDKRLAAGLERDLQKNIDDAIEAAGGVGWKDYLAEFASRSRGIEAAKEGVKSSVRPVVRTNLGGGMNVAEESRLHLPQMLSRPMMLANAIMNRLGKGVEPRLDAEATRRYLNPKALAAALEKLPVAERSAVATELERMGVVGAATAAGG